MIENFTILTKGGLVLWAYSFEAHFGADNNPINALIRQKLMEGHEGDADFQTGNYVLKWNFENELDLIFVVVYQRIVQMTYVDALLAAVRDAFAAQFRARDKATRIARFTFDEEFRTILHGLESKAEERASKGPRAFHETTKAKNVKSNSEPKKKKRAGKKPGKDNKDKDEDDEEDDAEDADAAAATATSETLQSGEDGAASPRDEASGGFISPPQSPTGATSERDTSVASEEPQSPSGADSASGGALTAEQIAENRKKLFAKKKAAAGGGGPGKKVTPVSPPQDRKKTKREWNDGNAKLSREEAAKLDFNKRVDKPGEERVDTVDIVMNERPTDVEEIDIGPETTSSTADDDGEEEAPTTSNGKPAAAAAGGWGSGMFSFFKNMAGGKPIERADLEPVMAKFKEHLTIKNVASEIASQMCDSVTTSLEGRPMPSMTRLNTVVREAVDSSLTRLLTPRRQIDILREAQVAKEEKRPYVIVFMGVNGVGKSTNLAKVCYWLKSNGLSVMMCACDTFRSGAVEQLKTHARRLMVPLFEQGYGGDISKIAAEAIRTAKKDKVDVVLVDTAGRMQDNTPLMQSLAKLIAYNNPDLTLFVGEALVGNDGVDQLVKFNNALRDFGDAENPRLVDGIVLTKFDTIDDKVGAAISMVYATGAPIVFVGTGQNYTDLRKINVPSVVRSLLR